MIKILGILFLHLISACSTPPKVAETTRPEIVDLATEFLDEVCSKPEGVQFSEAWLKYEEKHWDFFLALFYNSEASKAERAILAKQMAFRKDEMCRHTRSFLVVAPLLIKKAFEKVTNLMGVEPKSKMYLASALQWTDGRGDDYEGQEVYVLNARHDTYAETTSMVTTITHELIHSAQSTLHPVQVMQPPMVSGLYREGGAVYGVTLLFPEVGAFATGMNKKEINFAKRQIKYCAKELLTNWTSEDTKLVKKYFSGGSENKIVPRKMGYFMGLEIYRELKKLNPEMNVVKIAPEEFASKAKGILERIVEGK